jgi:hypothetical protein
MRRSQGRSTRPGSGPATLTATSISAAPTSSMSRTIRGSLLPAAFELTIRGVPRTVPLDVHYFGEWQTPFWVGDENKGELRRIGFEATARVNRHDFGVSWQDEIPGGGVVVSNEIELVLDVETILLEDLERTGAIEYYRDKAGARRHGHRRRTTPNR